MGGYDTERKDYFSSDAPSFDKYLEQVNIREGLTKHGGELLLKPRGKNSIWKWEKTDEETSNKLRYPYLDQWE